MRRFDYVVIGAGPAGGAAALELARDVTAPSVALVGNEAHSPYERPPLSKSALRSTSVAGPQSLFGGAPALAAAGIVTFAPVIALSIDRVARTVHLSSGGTLNYGHLLIATGASARRLDTAGGDLPGVHYLRTHDDAVRLAPALSGGARLVVIGGGFVGLEVAATAKQAGCRVVVIEAGARLMGRAVPPEISFRVQRKFATEGVEIRLNASITRLRGQDAVDAVELSSGECIPADVVLAGIGAVPNDSLAGAAGLEVENGIVVDRDGQTSDPLIYAAGDVASRLQQVDGHPAWRKRLEAWEPALEQGAAVAYAMLGRPPRPLPAPWVWSDQFDWNLQFAGHGELADQTVARHGDNADALTLFQLSRSCLVGAVTLNDSRNMALCRRALDRPLKLDPRRLADRDIPLKEALRPAAPSVSH